MFWKETICIAVFGIWARDSTEADIWAREDLFGKRSTSNTESVEKGSDLYQ